MKFFDAISKMFFEKLNMPFKVVIHSSKNSENKIDTNLFVQIPYLRNIYL